MSCLAICSEPPVEFNEKMHRFSWNRLASAWKLIPLATSNLIIGTTSHTWAG